MLALQREAFWAKERLLGDLRQPVPQNGRVHLHGAEVSVCLRLSTVARVCLRLSTFVCIFSMNHLALFKSTATPRPVSMSIACIRGRISPMFSCIEF